ncbi:MAG TPA: nucleotide sugar dehydrogenase [Sandaracinaceae bacterium LLY-WYZ-13_1]|nr:nucleotide sugar dehydrogenase [Sandaracinaceae bacterium LLY-WYZ-13_1]
MSESDAIGVIGLGYVGTVVAASLASQGRPVVGVDRRPEVVDTLARGVPPIPEPGLEERLGRARMQGTLRCTTDLAAAVQDTAASLVCVGTPVDDDGRLVERDVLEVCEAAARHAEGPHHVVIRSTVPPGLYRRALGRMHGAVGDDLGARVTLALNPEFLREGNAIADHEDPELVVFATDHEPAAAFLEALYAEQRDRLHRTDPSTAEVLKLVNNAWHALKVAFANEVARVTLPIGVDPFAVMRLLCEDRKLNTSAAYLRPGLPFGGACLVKDVASLASHAADHGVDAPLLGSILGSNDAHLDHLVDAVLGHAPKQAAIVGVGFKQGASDVRDSAPVRLVHRLLDAGIHVTVADAGILDATVPPLGLEALRHALGDPRAQAAPDVAHAVAGADVIVVGHPSEADRRALVALSPEQPILDAAGELSRKLSDEERAALAPVVVLSRE